MLQVSDMLEVSRRQSAGEVVGAAAPNRFRQGAQRPPVVIWNVCRHCNMSCPHCYAAASLQPAPTDLSTSDGLRLLEELSEVGVRVVIFSGGEPLLRGDLPQLMERAGQLGITPYLSTNGALIDDERAASLAKAGVAYVGISIDGPREFNDSYRGLAGGFDAAVRGLRCSKAAGLRTGLRLTLIRRNAQHLESMYRLAQEVGADRFYVSHLLYSGRGKALTGEDLTREQSRAALERLFALAEEGIEQSSALRVVTGSNDSDGPFLLRWIEERYGAEAAEPVRALLERRGGNSAGEAVINIDARGRVHPDQFWTTATFGDVRERPLAQILQHPLREELQGRADRLTGRCAGCSYLTLCRGSHRERAEAVYGDCWASDPACVLTDEEIGVTAAVAAGAKELA